jgi:enoyl-CoA hydratase
VSDIHVRIAGRAGRITLNRPQAMNALTWDMCRRIEAALDAWAADDEVAMLVIDGAGERAFCSGGDITEMYRTGRAGDFAYGRRFWADEYRMNRKMSRFPKPVASFLHGYTMGGGVGVGCHGTHRIVGQSSRIAMPECGIGLVPDVGGSLLLARAPGRVGEYLGVTGTRMGPGDALFAGFADHFVPQAEWPGLAADLERSGDATLVQAAAEVPQPSDLAARQADIDGLFAAGSLGGILSALAASNDDLAGTARDALGRNSPLSMACTVELVRRVREAGTIEAALMQEYRFTWRSMEHGDFLEGIRAAIIDKDRTPVWSHADPAALSEVEVERMLAPLGADDLNWEGT